MVVGRTITVVQRGQTVIDQQEIPVITGGTLDINDGLMRPIHLYMSEKGRVDSRNIEITPAT